MASLIKSFGFAFNGIRNCFIQERHFKIHALLAVVAITAGFYFNITTVEWFVVLICSGAVFTAELINTAIEQLCDIVHKENHPGIKLVKDLAAAAVLVSAITAAIAGMVIFIPKFFL